MKKLYYIIPFIIFIMTLTSCKSTKERDLNTTNTISDIVHISSDSLEYEIYIIEPGFNQWLATRKPRGFNTQYWLETRNNLLVNEYNSRVINTRQFDPNLYTQQIYYDKSANYGYEVNYLLWNWLEFFQEHNNQKLQ